LAIIGTHDAAHGPQDVLGTAHRELRLLAEHRKSQPVTCAPR
jgi:hypothetical protein